MKISLVLPAYNEETTIEATLQELENYMNYYNACNEWEIIVVNDGSTDGTVSLLEKIVCSKKWLKLVDLVTNCGRGKALRKGIEASSGDIIVSLDADLSYAPYHIERMVDKLKRENADIVVASAYGKGGSVKNVPLNRLWISWLGNKVLSYMFGGTITVLTCLVRAYRRDFFETLDLHSNDKEIHLEILSKAKILGAKIVEVPAELNWRDHKLKKTSAGKATKRRSTLKVRRTSQSHLFFAMMNKPGLIFRIPGYILLIVSMLSLLPIVMRLITDVSSGMLIYNAVRESMVTATPTWLTFTFAFVLSVQFFTLGFLTTQNKYNYEESYRIKNSILAELRKNKE